MLDSHIALILDKFVIRFVSDTHSCYRHKVVSHHNTHRMRVFIGIRIKCVHVKRALIFFYTVIRFWRLTPWNFIYQIDNNSQTGTWILLLLVTLCIVII